MSSLVQWQPVDELVSFRDAMDRLFDDSFVRPGRAFDDSSAMYLPLVIYTTKDAVVIRASVPGVNPEDVEITIEGSTVTIRGEIKPPQEQGS